MGASENFRKNLWLKSIQCTLKFAKSLYTKSTTKGLGNVHLQREQTVALLKEIIANDLAQPTAIFVRENKGKFELAIKDECRPPLQNFIAKKGLKFRINNEMGVCIIFKP